MIIGLTSFLASGKDTVGEMLVKREFERFSCSDHLREIAKKEGKELTRDNLVKIGNDLRKKHGSDILAEILVEKIKEKGEEKNFVIESIRTVGEIETFRKKLDNFTLVFIDTNSKTRYERAKKRLREKEHINSFKEFLASEKREMDDKKSTTNQQLHKCKKLADVTIENNGALEDLEKGVSKLLVQLQIKNQDKPDWHRYFLNIAEDIAKRSTCLSAHGGAVITKNNVIVATGYVGAPRETKDCYERGYCIRREMNIPSGHRYEICASVHAEQNAIINASREGSSTKGGTMYLFMHRAYEGTKKLISAYPCFICKKMIINAGIEKFVAQQENGTYKEYDVKDWIKEWKKKDIVDDKVLYNAKYK
jgi:dCMP deaminase